MDNLKPCPFCGSSNVELINLGGHADWYCECQSCTTQHHAKFTEAEAIAAWNSRPASDGSLKAEIERQEGLVKTYRGAQLRAEEKLCREQANAQGWKRRAELLETKLDAATSTPPASDGLVDRAIACINRHLEGHRKSVPELDEALAALSALREKG